ncbi:MAG: hypothetical protein AABZ77_06700 [Chloroflexota bacterium]
MKNIRQKGQALILTLILLAIGATMIVPALGLGSTSLKSSQIVTRQTKLLYAADAMQEFVMWKLVYDPEWRTANLGADGATANLSVDLCGIGVNAIVVMRAVPGQGGITLTTDDTIRPIKTVSPSTNISNRSLQTFTYIIRLEQLSNNNSQGLDAVYDMLPKLFGTNKYLAGSSYIRTDDGEWQSIADPSVQAFNGQDRLRWPASGSFASPIRDFAVRQVKELKFQVRLTLPSNADDYIVYNYNVLKVGTITTFSGPQAPIKIGNGSKSDNEGMLSANKTASPNIILPGEIQDITYNVTVSNNDTSTHTIDTITDFLPPEFIYVTGSTVGFGNGNPTATNVTINGVVRQRLVWIPPGSEKQISSGQTRTLTFTARTTKDVSGSYYNEVFFYSDDFSIPDIFNGLGLTDADFQQGYSWNGGTVIVPAYDSSSNASGVVVNANLALRGLSSILINSYQIR